MERIPIENRADLKTLITGLYTLLLDDDLPPDDLRLYDIDSEYVEAEIELPYIGLNLTWWDDVWSPERQLEVLLHEFAHIEEGPDEPDHGPAFYDRLAALTAAVETQPGEVESLFGATIDFAEVHDHLVDSVNEYTVEEGIDSVEERQRALRELFSAADTAQ